MNNEDTRNSNNNRFNGSNEDNNKVSQKALKKKKKRTIGQAIWIWFIYTVIVSFIPLFARMLIILKFDFSECLLELTFACITISIDSIRILVNSDRELNKKLKDIIFIFTLAPILFPALVYSQIISDTSYANNTVLFIISIFLVVSIICSISLKFLCEEVHYE